MKGVVLHKTNWKTFLLKLAPISCLLLWHHSVEAQQSKHLELGLGPVYSKLEGTNLTNPTRVTLFSKLQTAPFGELRWGAFGRSWYLRSDFLFYSYKEDPSLDFTEVDESITGTLTRYELGRVYRLSVRARSAVSVALVSEDTLHIDYPAQTFRLSKKNTNGAKLKLDSMLFRLWGSKSFAQELHGSLGVEGFLPNDAIKKHLTTFGHLRLVTRLGELWQLELSGFTRQSQTTTTHYEQRRQDLGASLHLRLTPLAEAP